MGLAVDQLPLENTKELIVISQQYSVNELDVVYVKGPMEHTTVGVCVYVIGNVIVSCELAFLLEYLPNCISVLLNRKMDIRRCPFICRYSLGVLYCKC